MDDINSELVFQPNVKKTKKMNQNSTITLNSVAGSLQNSKWKDPKTWPVELHNFIGRSFKLASKKQFNTNQVQQFKNQLKNLINMAIASNKIMENNWEKQELPLFIGPHAKLELYCNHGKSVINNNKTNNNTNINNINDNNESPTRKKNIFGEDETDSDISDKNSNNIDTFNDTTITTVNNKRTKKISLSESLKRLKKQKKEVKPHINELTDADKKSLRSKRFERELSTPINYDNNDTLISTDSIIGRNQNLEKKYLRLTSQPNPDTVRPLNVLHKTLKFLSNKYLNGATYNYLCDQCKSLRQDLTVQNIKHNFTIIAYEFHSKLAIEYRDWGEFNQCQSQLKILYNQKNLDKPNYFEFLAYRILYYTLTDHGNEVYELELELFNDGINEINNEFFNYALQIFKAITISDYYLLSQIVIEIHKKNSENEELAKNNSKFSINDDIENDFLTLKHNKFYYFTKFIACIVERENIRTLSILCCGYRQLPVPFLRDLLCIENDEKFQNFIKENNLASFINENDNIFNCHQAKLTVENLKNKLFKKIDIKGQV
jgi:hypothetical protein